MTLFRKPAIVLRRAVTALLNANLRYTRIVHGDRALADRGAAPAGSARRAASDPAVRR